MKTIKEEKAKEEKIVPPIPTKDKQLDLPNSKNKKIKDVVLRKHKADVDSVKNLTVMLLKKEPVKKNIERPLKSLEKKTIPTVNNPLSIVEQIILPEKKPIISQEFEIVQKQINDYQIKVTKVYPDPKDDYYFNERSLKEAEIIQRYDDLEKLFNYNKIFPNLRYNEKIKYERTLISGFYQDLMKKKLEKELEEEKKKQEKDIIKAREGISEIYDIYEKYKRLDLLNKRVRNTYNLKGEILNLFIIYQNAKNSKLNFMSSEDSFRIIQLTTDLKSLFEL